MEYAIIGKRTPKIDGVVKAMGAARFSGDMVLPRMLYAKVLRSPHAHARIIHIDTGRAERLPGVKAVITGKDTAGVRYGVFPQTRDELALALDVVRYIGDEVAAVAAVDEDTAREALDLIKVDYDPMPAVFDPVEAMKPGALRLHEQAPGNIAVHVRIPFGDADGAFAGVDHIREDRFQTQFISHCQMEPYAILASFQPSGELEVWVPNASPFTRKRALSNLLRLPMDNVRVHQVFIGGHFGGRSELMSGDYCASLLSMKAGRPVRLTYTREETFCNTRQKHAFDMEVKTGVRRDGTLVAQAIRVVADGGAYVSTGAIAVTVPAVMLLAVYRVPHFLYEAYRVYTNKPPCGAMRGHGSQQIRFAVERQMDMIAGDLDLDPVEMRLKNAVEAGDILPNRSKVTSCGLRESVLETVEASSWRERRGALAGALKSTSSVVQDGVNPQGGALKGASGGVQEGALKGTPGGSGRGLGLGLASMISGFSMGVRTLSGAFVKFNEDGQVTLLTGIVDNGQGNETMAAQIAAEELGTGVEDIRVINGDTATTPQDPGSYSMQSTFTGGNAVRAAAVDARRQILEIAAEKLEANPADLDLKEKRVFVKGSPERGMGLRDTIWAGLAVGRPVLGRGHYMPPVDPADWFRGRIDGQMTGAYTFGATVAEVEVDRETGQVTVLEVAAAHDCGRAINPMLVEGQIEGSIPLGQGQALTEDVVQREGQVLNPNFAGYGMPTAADAPRVKSIIVEAEDPNGPFGAKEAAESINIAIVPALASAVEDAIGADVRSLPITAEKVLNALDSQRIGKRSQRTG